MVRPTRFDVRRISLRVDGRSSPAYRHGAWAARRWRRARGRRFRKHWPRCNGYPGVRGGGCRAVPGCGSMCPAGRPALHPGTIPPAACCGRARAGPRQPSRQSCPACLLRFGNGFRVLRVQREAAKPECGQLLARGALVHRHADARFDPVLAVNSPPAHHPSTAASGPSRTICASSACCTALSRPAPRAGDRPAVARVRFGAGRRAGPASSPA